MQSLLGSNEAGLEKTLNTVRALRKIMTNLNKTEQIPPVNGPINELLGEFELESSKK